MAFFILTRFVLVKYSRAFVERPSQGTSSLASQLTTVSLDIFYIEKLQTQIQEITNQLQMLHLKQIQVIQPGAFHKD